MDKLWAPWRINYIQNIPEQKGCIFCDALASSEPEKNFLLLTTDHSLAMLNTFPYNNGHLLVAPRRHSGELESFSPGELTDMLSCTTRLTAILKELLKPDGFNIGINIGKSAGAGFDSHLHLHIVPRWTGDTNFMSVCSDTKVISQSLRELYTRIKQCLEKKI